jgi:hypothetical protein
MTAEFSLEGFDNFLYQHYTSEEDKRHELSKQHLRDTKLSREIRKLAKKKEGIFYTEEAFKEPPKWKVSEDSSFDGFAWDIRDDENGFVIGTGIAVEALPNGSIFIRGGSNATKLLLFNEWMENRNVLFRAFKEAIEKPMTIVF